MKTLLLTTMVAATLAMTSPTLAQSQSQDTVAAMTGRAADLVKSGDVDTAEEIYDFLLSLAPNHPRFLLDMAHIQMLKRNWADAKANMLKVRGFPGVPDHVLGAINGRLAYIEERTYRQRLHSQISFGLTSQSNVNSGPEDLQIDIFGLPFTLSPSAMPQSDIIARAAIEFDYRLRLGDSDSFFNAQMSYIGLKYDEFDTLNRQDLGVKLGFLVPLENFPLAQSQFQIHAGVNKTWIDDDAYLDSSAILATYSATPTERLHIRLGASYQQDDYITSAARPAADARDGHKSTLSFTGYYALENSWRLMAGIEHAELDAEAAHNSWAGHTLRLGISKKYASPIAALPGIWTTALSVEQAERNYAAPERMFSADPQSTDVRRINLVQTVPLTLATEAKIGLSSAEASSNYDIYSWKDRSLSLSIVYKF